MKGTLKITIPILVSIFIGLIVFIYTGDRAQSKDDIDDVKDIANTAITKADDSLEKVSKVEGDLRVLDEKVTGQVNNINTNIDWIKRAMIDNGIKPR